MQRQRHAKARKILAQKYIAKKDGGEVEFDHKKTLAAEKLKILDEEEHAKYYRLATFYKDAAAVKV